MVVRIFVTIILFAMCAFAAGAVEDVSTIALPDTSAGAVDASAVASFDTSVVSVDSLVPDTSVAEGDSAAALAADSVVSDSVAADTVAADSAVKDTVVKDSAVAVKDSAKRDSVSRGNGGIPLPHQSAYTGFGLLVGLAAGLFNPTEECDCLGVWQGQVEYFYSDWVSGGFDVRFFGGDLDTDMMVRYQRYRMNVRFHFPHERWSWYISPIVEFESTDLEDIRDEWHQRDMEGWIPGVSTETEQEVEDCEKMFSLDGFSVGVDLGGGVVFWDILGTTANILYEYNFGGAQLLTISPGIAYNLQAIWPWAKKSLSAAWVSIETGFQRFFNRSVDSLALAGYLGVAVGF